MATFDRFDICAAYYLFGSLYHSGQGSKEYAYMGRAINVGYNDGALGARFESLSENGKAIYGNLVSAWEEANNRIPSDMFERSCRKLLRDPMNRAYYMRAKENLKQELFGLHEVSANPKAEKCFDLAWEYGHAMGYEEVRSYFSELVNLIKLDFPS